MIRGYSTLGGYVRGYLVLPGLCASGLRFWILDEG